MTDLYCPECGYADFQELSYRWTWQPVTIDATTFEPVDYGSFDYGDEVYLAGVSCVACDTCWPTYNDLKLATQGQPHALGQAEITFSKDGIPE